MRENGLLSLSDLGEYFVCWWCVTSTVRTYTFSLLRCLPTRAMLRKFEKMYRTLIMVETWMDLQAYKVKTVAWLRGLWTKGFEGARKAAAGLA
jgi:aarF domain-containing kinase